MKCSFCGNEMEEGTRFCPVCGTEISEEKESNSDYSQPASQYEDPNAHCEENQTGGYDQPDNSQGGYGYGQPGNNQGGYGYDQPDNNQGGYGYGQPGNNQGGYGYGQPDNNQGSYGYGQPDNGQGSYGYGQPNGNQDGYSYGQPGNNQGGYGQPGNNQGGYGYGQPGNNQGGYGYGQPNNYGQAGNNFNQPVKQISGTPYMVFSILITLCCCLPLGIAGIIYASKINSLQKMGDYAGAQDAAKKAKIFIIVGAIGGLILSVIAGVSGVVDGILESDTDSSIFSEDWDDADDDDVKAKPSKKVEASGDLGDSWMSFTVQINENVLTFPCAVSDIEAAGLTLDTDDVAEDYIINKDDYELVYFEDANDNDIMFVVSNNAEEARTVRECMVTGIYINDYDVENSDLTFIFPGEIRLGMSIDDVIAKWGEPTDSYEGEYSNSYYWYDDNSTNYCSVSTEPDTDKITTIDLDGQDLE